MLELGDPELPERLDALVEPLARGDPESPLRWTSKSTRALAAELTAEGHRISHETVAQLLRHMNYSLQGNRKAEEGADHPDRDAQFRFINNEVRKALAGRRPVISVDTKKKELLGNYENAGRQWRKAKNPQHVKVHGELRLERGQLARGHPDDEHGRREIVEKLRRCCSRRWKLRL